MPDNAADLARIQRWFHASITHPDGVRNGLKNGLASDVPSKANRRLEDIVLPSNALSSIERLSIYANMYFDRLIEILAEEFPSVRHLLGVQIFADVVKCYLTRYPSTHYSLSKLGSKFPRYLLDGHDEFDLSNREFASAVATVERTMEDVFDEAQAKPLLFDQLQAIPTDSWKQMQLTMIPALRLLALPFPVNDYISAVRDQRAAEVPAAGRSFVIVYRAEFHIWRVDLDERQFTLLSELHDGRTLGTAVGVCAELPGSNPAALADDLYQWFRNWAAEGFFRKVEIVTA